MKVRTNGIQLENQIRVEWLLLLAVLGFLRGNRVGLPPRRASLSSLLWTRQRCPPWGRHMHPQGGHRCLTPLCPPFAAAPMCLTGCCAVCLRRRAGRHRLVLGHRFWGHRFWGTGFGAQVLGAQVLGAQVLRPPSASRPVPSLLSQ